VAQPWQTNGMPLGSPDLRQQFPQPLYQTMVIKNTATELTINLRL
jgi:hypothetical protein